MIGRERGIGRKREGEGYVERYQDKSSIYVDQESKVGTYYILGLV